MEFRKAQIVAEVEQDIYAFKKVELRQMIACCCNEYSAENSSTQNPARVEMEWTESSFNNRGLLS